MDGYETPHGAHEESDRDNRLKSGHKAPDSRQVNDCFAFFDGLVDVLLCC